MEILLGIGVMGLLLLGWLCIPPLFHLMGLSRYRCSIEHASSEEFFGASDPIYPGVFTQLNDLGFKPLGVMREEVWFFGPHWFFSTKESVFGSLPRESFACVYRLFRGEPVRVAFGTGFEDGSMVWTSNHTPIYDTIRNAYVYQSFVTTDLKELFEKHREVAQRFREMGRQSSDHESLPTLMRLSVPLGRRMLQRRNWPTRFLVIYFVVLILLPTTSFFMGLLLSGDLEVAYVGTAAGFFLILLGLVYIRWRMLGGEACQREKELYSSGLR